jgi:hypothetical protein
MALKDTNGKYLKIDNYDLNNNSVTARLFENEEHRTNGDTEFKKSYTQDFSLPSLKTNVMNINANSDLTVDAKSSEPVNTSSEITFFNEKIPTFTRI